jgi:bifunctional non-homologous end joining protein LigD
MGIDTAKLEPLSAYSRKRDFKVTSEPEGSAANVAARAAGHSFTIQKHWASRLHYDFRLELDGVLLSWAVPKGPSYDPAIKQMAIHVEDHPVSYGWFEGTIPKGQYGAGNVIVWDRGTWEPIGNPQEGMINGKLLFKLHGQKLAGLWELVRISKPGEKKQDEWMLFKKRGDAWARPLAAYDVISALPDSVVEKPLGLVEEREPRHEARHAEVADNAPDLSNAVAADMPPSLDPQLATLIAQAPTSGRWVVESKLDGYRMLARIGPGSGTSNTDGNTNSTKSPSKAKAKATDKSKTAPTPTNIAPVRLITRNGHDWTDKLQPLATAIATLGIKSAWLDGEIVVLNQNGVPDFGRLQMAIDQSRTQDVVYFVFDVPYLGDEDLRKVPLESRRAVLKELLKERGNDKIRFSEAFDQDPAQMLDAACRLGLEGIMLKRADAPYASGRTDTWLKLKCQHRQEFVVVGFTDRANEPGQVGGLLLAVNDEHGTLQYAGSVGTGWSKSTGADLYKRLTALEAKKPAVDAATVTPGRWSKRVKGAERWVEPTMVVEVAFTEWTEDNHLRHPTFKGLRTDKPASQIRRERAGAPPDANGALPLEPQAAKPAPPLKVTNPTRVIDPTTGATKLDLARYYESIAEFILPHLMDRPVSLVRAPEGITGELFFQKHPETRMPGMTSLDPSLWPGHSALLTVDSAASLTAAAQMNVIEFHTWNSTAKHIDQPDRVIFDLDPGEGVTWAHLQEAAQLMRALLQQLGLESWLKTSGGKGLHVVVPLAPKLAYDIVKGFSQAAVQHMARVIPQRFVAKSGGSNRVGKIFIDYLRNGHGQTTASAFSARSRPGLGVSMPIDWAQLQDVKSGAQWTIATAREYLSFQAVDPWKGYWTSKQTLTAAIETLGYQHPKAR